MVRFLAVALLVVSASGFAQDRDAEQKARQAAREKAAASCAHLPQGGERNACVRDATPPMDCAVEPNRQARDLCERSNAVNAACKGKSGQAFVDCARGIGMSRR
jgi:hypothetical protein